MAFISIHTQIKMRIQILILGTVLQIEKALINDPLRVSKVS